jgi:uncharacterized protein
MDPLKDPQKFINPPHFYLPMKYVNLLLCIILLIPSHVIDAQSPVTIIAPAVERTPSGLQGVLSYITVHTEKGNGHVFIDTWPLAEVDIQGSARLAVQVASDVVHKDWRAYDFFITVRSDSPIIGGPSAGGAMTVAVIAALQEWELSPGVVMSGTINPDETVGPVGGLDQKAKAASEVASLFLVPEGQTTIMVEEQEPFQVGPFTYVTTTQKEVNLVEEGKNMGLEVKEVYDIREAVFYFTGNTIESPHIEAEPIKADFMKSYAQKELEETQEEYTTTQERINAYSGSYKEDLEDVLRSAEEEIVHANKTYESGTYYTSMSASFVAGLYITYADNLLSYFNGQSVEEIFGSLDEYLNTLYEEIKTEHPHGMTALQCIAAAQMRVFEALDYLQQAQEKEDFEHIQYASYAQRRGESTEFWLSLAREYQNGEEITEEALESAASSMINTAELSLVYASSILPQSNVLQEAEDILKKAETEYMNRIYASSLFSALQSKVYSEVALIAYSPEKNITQKVERARERASNAIETSRKRGIEPVLAVTYYELAEASDSIQSLLYLRYAEEIASIHNYLENQPETPVEIISPQQGGEPKQKTGESLLFLVIGIFIGIGISWIVVRVTR